MIRRLAASRLDRATESGRTTPAFVVCEADDGEDVEVIAKLSAGCDLGATALALELFCACLAGKIGLPIPEPLIVDILPDWLDALGDHPWAQKARRSNSCAFGSRRLPSGYSIWIAGSPLVGSMPQIAAAILLFDAIVDNPDRRVSNPNCLVRGDDLRIIDHELALAPVPLIGWRPPWMAGATATLGQGGPGQHIFFSPLQKLVVDWEPLASAWGEVEDAELAVFRAAVPAEWSEALPAIDRAIEKIINARASMDGCIGEVRRLLA